VYGGASVIMLLFYFYSICFLNKSRYFNAIILLSSTTIIIIGILGVDRSKSFYWILTYGFMMALFWRHMSKRIRKQIFIVSLVLVSLVVVYIASVTVSRFEGRSSGTEGGIISYAGQPYINFCLFFDEVYYDKSNLQR